MVRKTMPPGWPPPRFSKETFFLASAAQLEGLTKFLEEEGGQVVSAINLPLDYLVIGYRLGNRKTPVAEDYYAL